MDSEERKVKMVRVLMTPLLYDLILQAAGGKGLASAWIRGACTARLMAEQADPATIREATIRDAARARAAVLNDPLRTAGRVTPPRRAEEIFSNTQ